MDNINNVLETVFSNKYGSIVLTMFLVFYSGLAAPKLPSFIRELFNNPIFRILILSLIVYKGNKDPELAIMIAVGFTVTMNFISSQKFFENFSNHDDSIHGGGMNNSPQDPMNSPDHPMNSPEHPMNSPEDQMDSPEDQMNEDEDEDEDDMPEYDIEEEEEDYELPPQGQSVTTPDDMMNQNNQGMNDNTV